MITLDKQNKNVTVVTENKTAEELAQEAERIPRSLLVATPASDNFAHIEVAGTHACKTEWWNLLCAFAHAEGLAQLCRFAGSLENSEGFKVPLVNTLDNRQMVNQKMKEHLESILEDCQSAEEGQLKKG